MPQKYTKAVGSRAYKNYTEDTLKEALIEVVEGRLSLSKASQIYKIPLGTLHNKYHGKHVGMPGGRTALSDDEEKSILEAFAICGDWGFPLSLIDLRLFTKYYLEAVGKSSVFFFSTIFT